MEKVYESPICHKLLMLLLAITCIQFSVYSQGIVTGKVTTAEDDSGLPGATILIKGTNQGTATDALGNFKIEVSGNDAVLVISSVGFTSEEITVGGRSIIDIALSPDMQSLSEVLIVGYGTMEKENLTGSVSSVKSEILLERPATNAANLLQGRVTGLEVTQSSGQPGRDDPTFQIRGLGSFGASSSPLVLVDGIIGSITNLAPSDIESVTVLKDAASASIYGSRAANGVILVTTKKGAKGPATIEYRMDVGFHNATRLPEFITNSAEYMEMYNVASVRSGQSPIYTEDQIAAYRNATDRELFPNFDAVDHYFKQSTAINHYLGVSGGNDNTSYKLSLGYLNQDGILANHDFQRYNALFNLRSKVKESITIGTTLNFSYKDIQEPWMTNDNIVLAVYQHGPTYKPFLPDGSGRRANRAYSREPTNQVAPNAFYNGGIESSQYALNAQAFMEVDLMEGLTWHTKAGVNYANNFSKNHQFNTPIYLYQKVPGEEDFTLDNNGGSLNLGVTDNYSKSVMPTIFSTLNYEKKLGDGHGINFLAGYEQQSFQTNFISGYRQTFPTPALKELNAGAAAGQSVSGSSNEWALRSYFSRASYNYKNRYLVEGNARYDGTSRVSPQYRWGLFPSASLGWRLSEEEFIDFAWLDEFKIRGSLGKLGNQEIGLYPYQDILNLTSYPFGASLDQGVLLTRLTDKELRWETTKMIDIGLDFSVFNGMFDVTLDWFKRNTTDILATQPVPRSLGLSGPITNDGELQNTGWEAAITHQKQIGEFYYSANFLFSTFRNELLSIVTPTRGIREVGLPYNSYFMYEWEGIFQSQQDIDSSPRQIFYNPAPGDLKIKDQNGDNIIDEEDRISISPYPDYTYSFGVNTKWKGFNLSVFFQGVKGRNLRIWGWGYDPFVQGDPPTTRFRDAWSPDNPSNTVPGLYLGTGWYEGGYGGVQAYPSTYNLQDASYLRLKNVNLSYTLPNTLTERLKFQGITVYISGDNLLTFTNYEGADPERLGEGRMAQFPQVRILNMGLNVSF